MSRSPQHAHRPIGVFDSGIGGLTVVKELVRQLPHEEIVYFGDTARVPYGTKSRSTIIKFSLENVEFLLRFNVKCIVIACNTSSAFALPTLRNYFKVPIIGTIRPGARAALGASRTKRIGVIGTQATVHSGAYAKELSRLNGRVRVTAQSCPLFVPLVEEGWLSTAACAQIARTYLAPLRQARVDTLVLGCTHYPLLAPVLQRVMGPRVTLIDSARETAAETRELLGRFGLLRQHGTPRHRFFVTDEPERFRAVGRRFLGAPLARVKRVTIN